MGSAPLIGGMECWLFGVGCNLLLERGAGAVWRRIACAAEECAELFSNARDGVDGFGEGQPHGSRGAGRTCYGHLDAIGVHGK